VFNGSVGFPYPAPADQGQFVDIGSTATSLSQSFTLTDTRVCHLTWVDNAAQAGATSPYAVVITDGASQTVVSNAYDAAHGPAWQMRSIDVVLAAGTYTLSFAATGVVGGLGTLIDNAVMIADSAAGIITQPAAVSTCSDGPVSFTVAAAGAGPLGYQWRLDGNPLNTIANSSAATATLVIASPSPAQAGGYDCVVTNACGSATSAVAVLSITTCACGLADVASDSLDTVRNPNGSIGAEDLDAFIAAFILGDPAVADVASDSLDTTYNPNGSVGAEDLDAFIASFIVGC